MSWVGCVSARRSLTEVADEFGTPTYLIDEADFRHRIRCYRAAVPRGSIGLGRKGTPDHRCRELGGGRRRMSWRGFAWRARDRAHRWRRSEPDRAALVAVKDRRSRELVRRETIADLLARTASRRSTRGSGHLGVGADIWQRVTLSTTTSTPTHNPVDDRSVRRNGLKPLDGMDDLFAEIGRQYDRQHASHRTGDRTIVTDRCIVRRGSAACDQRDIELLRWSIRACRPRSGGLGTRLPIHVPNDRMGMGEHPDGTDARRSPHLPSSSIRCGHGLRQSSPRAWPLRSVFYGCRITRPARSS